jgi:hypothetical protein
VLALEPHLDCDLAMIRSLADHHPAQSAQVTHWPGGRIASLGPSSVWRMALSG